MNGFLSNKFLLRMLATNKHLKICRLGGLTLFFLAIINGPCCAQQQPTTASSSPTISIVIERTTQPVGQSTQDFLSQFGQPGYINYVELKNKLQRKTVEGINATYMGWCTMSDINGRITFPRRQDKNEITLVITRSLEPVLIDENLVHHFIAGEPVAFYNLKLKDAPNKTGYWEVTELPTPKNRVVPLYALVIIAKPDQIMLYKQYKPAIRGPDLILPTLYARTSLTPAMNALHFLKINRYFSPVKFAQRFAKERYAKMVTV